MSLLLKDTFYRYQGTKMHIKTILLKKKNQSMAFVNIGIVYIV